MTADVSTTRADADAVPAGADPARPGADAVVDDPAPASPGADAFHADPVAWTQRFRSPALLAAGGIYVAAGGHVAASLVHLSHGWRITVFFIIVAAVQVLVAGRVARGVGDRVTAAVLTATLGLVLLYVASRTVNLPFGGVHTVHNDRPQDPDFLGTVVVAAELLTLVAGQALLPGSTRRVATNAMLAVGAGLWVAWGTGLL